MQNGACFAMLWDPPEARRKSASCGVLGLSIWLLIWLGLVYWSATRRPNHQHKCLRRSCHLTFAKGTASSFATKFCSKSPDFERSWAENPSKLVPGHLKIAPKWKLKGMQSRSPSNALINHRFFFDFIDSRTPNWTTKALKFASKTKSKKQ